MEGEEMSVEVMMAEGVKTVVEVITGTRGSTTHS